MSRKKDAIDVDSFAEYQELVHQVLHCQPHKLTVFVDLDDVKKAAKVLTIPPESLVMCHVPSHHVTLEPTTRLPVRTSYPDTTGTHPATRGMSGPLRKNLCIRYASEHNPATVSYWFLFGTTSDDTTLGIIRSNPGVFQLYPYPTH